ncbi:discoidin domain-containing protein [Saccharothrix yanglingensis]|uniref:Glucan endo-1,6-beta-glucosidase n=1 Tax=Saccharothrix yanglingensis TaxID=659496 RepID=A0ABU0X090_9PSEU|nr:discoidin domain-containing protein [Saccharothrix yanglingensis]MDQ2583984.1 glucan endo-1,6-beta-glucosidase [Saccharothrix yanglingensis]
MRRTVAAVGVAVALTASAVTSGQASGEATGQASGPRPGEVAARVWVTTPDRAELLAERPRVAFGTTPSTHPTIVVDPDRTYQAVDGFGASITDSSAAVLHGLAPDVRAKTMRDLFDPVHGIGVSFLRQPVGSSDFTAEAEHYTYDDVPPGRTDFALRHFSIAHDEAVILPLLREAKRLNPRLKVMATPWSPPAWMKTTDSLVGGRLQDDPRVYDAYARYLVKFVQAYTAAGVPIDFLSVQNEPQNRTPDAYPGTDMPVAQQLRVVEALGPKLRSASPRTAILGYDHNWATHPNDAANTPPGASPETDYPYRLLSSRAARWIAGTAYHCYYGDPGAQAALHDAFPDKGIWFTECSGSKGAQDPPAKVFRDTLTWHARNVVLGTTRNWARSAVNWNIALDSTGGPHNGGCATCTGLVTVQPDGSVTTDAEYYTIGHLSKFVKPGAKRIASTSFGTTGWNGQVMDVAFRNPDGSTALVVHNENDDPRTFAVEVGERTFEYTLPGGALATFTWPRSPALTSRFDFVPLTGATATASPGVDARLAVDDDASTRWSTGAAQAPGQYLQVDLGERERFRRVAVDSGGNLGDFARGYRLSVSDDGTRWRTLATGVGTGQLTTVDVPTTRARHLRVTATEASGSWWSVADVRLYR